MSEVYFIQFKPTGAIKIGSSWFVESRIKTIAVTCPGPIVLLATAPNIKGLEQRLHKRFKKYRVHGEWFEPADQILKYISRANERNRKVLNK